MHRFIRYSLFILLPTLLFAQPDPERRDFRQVEKRQFGRAQSLLNKAATQNQRQFDVSFYGLDIDVSPEQHQLSGSVQIEGTSLEPGLNLLEIDLYNHLTVDSVTQSGLKLPFTHADQILRIELAGPVNSGERFAVRIYYHGNPFELTYRSFGWNTHGPAADPIIWTLSEPYGAPAWWPCKDDPSDKADSVAIDVTVPVGLVAASNGTLTWVTENTDLITYHWRTGYPISTYLVSLTISNYAQFSDWYRYSETDSMEITYFVYPEHLDKAKVDFDITSDMMAFYASVFGEYPFLNEKYGMAIFPWGGGMEHQTITSYGAGLITGTHRYDWINAHELAHQWFGDCITIRHWSEIWLNEGFASYAEALWIEHLSGEAQYHNYMNAMDYPPLSGALFVSDSLNDNALFSRTVYDKGAWLLHMLRGVIGDNAFFKTLKTYATHPDLAYGNTTTYDLQKVAESVSSMDLGWFFDQWVYRNDRPNYEVQWSISGDSPFITTINILQVNQTPFKMPLQIKLTCSGNDTVITIWDSLNVQNYQVLTDGAPESLVVDPDNWVMKNLTVSRVILNLNTHPEQFTVSQNYPNPFNPVTRIQVSLPEKAVVRYEIYNVIGELVFQDMRERTAGFHTLFWDGLSDEGLPAPSGLYFYRVSYPGNTMTKKMLLIR